MGSRIFIETARLILREWIAADEAPDIALNQDNDVMEFFPGLATDAKAIAQIQRFTNRINNNGYGFFAVERKDNHQFIGFTGLSNPMFEAYFTPCVEVGWRLGKANWGYGFATEAAMASLKFGFNEPGIDEIYAFTAIHNVRSENVMKKIGMIKQGYFDNPMIEEGHSLKKHVLYKIDKPANQTAGFLV